MAAIAAPPAMTKRTVGTGHRWAASPAIKWPMGALALNVMAQRAITRPRKASGAFNCSVDCPVDK